MRRLLTGPGGRAPLRGGRGPAAAVAVLIVAATAACGSPGSPAARADRPDVTATPQVTDAARLTLPVRRHQFTAAELNRVLAARDVLAGRCVQRFGLDFRPRTEPAARPPFTPTERRYGLADAELAASRGYHLPPDAPADTGQRPQRPTADEQLVLFGPGPSDSTASFRGTPLPENGCMGEAERKLAGDRPLGDAAEIRNVNVGSLKDAQGDPRVKDVFAKWSRCMAERGHTYAHPFEPAREFTGPRPTEREIATAEDDVACKRRTNLVGVWYAVDAARQREILAAGGDELEAAERHKAAQLTAAREALGK
ncbi:hypothetical protein GCM10027168_66040 [Streptomyces capparidis]